jgi:hypothetical protein
MMSVTDEFRDLALSFYGCDGGNPDFPIWTCGLEWGGGLKENEIPPDEFSKTDPCTWDSPGESVRACLSGRRMGYNQKLAWFFSFFLGWDIYNYKREAEEQKLFCKSGIGFKMNAFPISFKNRNSVIWSENIIKQTGLSSFHDYRVWCVENRGKYFTDLLKKHSPKIVLCTGINSYIEFHDFFRCNKKDVMVDNNIYIAKANGDKTLVFVVPFFGGAHGINSYEKMEELVRSVKKHCYEHFRSEGWISMYMKGEQIPVPYKHDDKLPASIAQPF